jgi:hypothetical protein
LVSAPHDCAPWRNFSYTAAPDPFSLNPPALHEKKASTDAPR